MKPIKGILGENSWEYAVGQADHKARLYGI
jgi:hypothetical protein